MVAFGPSILQSTGGQNPQILQKEGFGEALLGATPPFVFGSSRVFWGSVFWGLVPNDLVVLKMDSSVRS